MWYSVPVRIIDDRPATRAADEVAKSETSCCVGCWGTGGSWVGCWTLEAETEMRTIVNSAVNNELRKSDVEKGIRRLSDILERK
jgi:hypothetical protein